MIYWLATNRYYIDIIYLFVCQYQPLLDSVLFPYRLVADIRVFAD